MTRSEADISTEPEGLDPELDHAYALGGGRWSDSPFHIMTKPIGPVCNLDCEYCYYLEKHDLYPGNSKWRMTDETLEAFVKQYIEAQPPGEVVFGWQGGEPTLMGVGFFEKAVAFQKKHCPEDKTVVNTLQTNGTLLNQKWCDFFRENDFLIGISIDGPARFHDKFRVDRQGEGVLEKVVAGLRLMKRHNVKFNILCTVHRANQEHPHETYNFFKDLGSEFVQFIPIVEHMPDNHVSQRSVEGEAYGDFLIGVFDAWVRQDVGTVYVQIFDVALGTWLTGQSSLCVFSKVCGRGLAMEHNGDLYSCDHFVEPEYLLGNINEIDMETLVNRPDQLQFGLDKQETLPKYCLECEVKFACNGGCPKNRIIQTPDGEDGLNYLCAGYRKFFNYIDPYMRVMAELLRRQRSPMEIMPYVRKYGGIDDRVLQALFDPSAQERDKTKPRNNTKRGSRKKRRR